MQCEDECLGHGRLCRTCLQITSVVPFCFLHRLVLSLFFDHAQPWQIVEAIRMLLHFDHARH